MSQSGLPGAVMHPCHINLSSKWLLAPHWFVYTLDFYRIMGKAEASCLCCSGDLGSYGLDASFLALLLPLGLGGSRIFLLPDPSVSLGPISTFTADC